MASSPSPSLRLELMATGDQSGTWGDTTNTNLGTLLEQAITGYLSVAQGDVANLTLTTTNYATDQARNAVIEVTGALTATRNVVVQTAEKLYTIKNSTTGGFSIVAKTSAGTGISIPPGASIDCYSDGTNVVQGANYWTGSIGGVVYLDAGAAVGPNFDLFRDSTSPAISDILGRVTFNGRDNAANKQEYASIETVIADATSTSEDGQLDLYATKAGTRTKFLSMTATATALTGAAAYSMDAPLTVSSTAAGTLATLTSTDAGAAFGPVIDLYRDSASPVANDVLGGFEFNGRDTGGAKQIYARINTLIRSETAGNEAGSINFAVTDLGSITSYLTIDPTVGVSIPKGWLAFPATQNPSSNANTLDDYEEGTWTPGLTFNGSATGITYSNQTGTYVKIGQLVFVQARIILTNNGSGVGGAALTGLPFTSANTTYNTLPFGFWSSMTSVVGNPMVLINNNDTGGAIYMSGGGNAVGMTDTNIGNSADMAFSGTYRAAN
jgi:hypothetical protein